jgi:hypothetical protein
MLRSIQGSESSSYFVSAFSLNNRRSATHRQSCCIGGEQLKFGQSDGRSTIPIWGLSALTAMFSSSYTSWSMSNFRPYSRASHPTAARSVRRSSKLTVGVGNSNLQRLPLQHMYALSDIECQGCDIYFFDDLQALPRIWQSANLDNVGELLIDFFRYYAKDFNYTSTVVSLRSEHGLLWKDTKGWESDVSPPLPSHRVHLQHFAESGKAAGTRRRSRCAGSSQAVHRGSQPCCFSGSAPTWNSRSVR